MADPPPAQAVDVQPISSQEMKIAQSGAAIFANKFFVIISPAGTRIAFAEQSPDLLLVFRSAVFLSIADTFALAGLLKDLLETSVVVTQSPDQEVKLDGAD